MLKISIPVPCHEKWDAMNPSGHGRFCDVCSKTVVDFTQMSDEEVKNFLLASKDNKPCGRFNVSQLQQPTIEIPSTIVELPMAGWKRFLIAALVVFSTTIFSCEVKHPFGKQGTELPIEKEAANKHLSGSGMVGGIMFSRIDSIIEPDLPDTTVVPADSIPEKLMGIPVPIFDEETVDPDSLFEEIKQVEPDEPCTDQPDSTCINFS